VFKVRLRPIMFHVVSLLGVLETLKGEYPSDGVARNDVRHASLSNMARVSLAYLSSRALASLARHSENPSWRPRVGSRSSVFYTDTPSPSR
jgi:hypothetical protein